MFDDPMWEEFIQPFLCSASEDEWAAMEFAAFAEHKGQSEQAEVHREFGGYGWAKLCKSEIDDEESKH